MPYDELLTVSEAARLLRVSEETIRRRIRAGELTAVGGPRSQRIRRADLLTGRVAEGRTTVYRVNVDSASSESLPERSLSPQTVARLAVQARAAGMDPDTFLGRWLTDYEETVAALEEAVADVEAGRVIDLDDHIAEVRKRRRQRDLARQGGYSHRAA